MPTLGAPLEFSKYEARNLRAHVLGTAPATPVTGQLYFNSADNTLYWWDGSAWVSARGGASATPPATTTTLGTVQLAGDLTGTATSPQIASGVITDVEVATANKDGANATASMRTLSVNGNTATTGQALSGKVTLDKVVPPAADMNFNNVRLTGVNDPANLSDAATKYYVDTVAQGLDAKQSVYVATTGNITLSGLQTVDDIAVATGDRVLVKNQSAVATNGVYVAGTGAWTRVTDLDNWNEFPGAYFFVEKGTLFADTGWVCTNDQGGTLGTTAVTFTQFSGAGSFNAGAGLMKIGNSLEIGQGSGITVASDLIQVANNGITNAMLADGAVNLATADVTGALPIANGGTGGTTSNDAKLNLSAAGWYAATGPPSPAATWTILRNTHNGRSGTRGYVVQVQDAATGAIEIPDVVVNATGDVIITYGASVAANSKLVTILS